MYFKERLKQDLAIIEGLKTKKDKMIYIWDYYKIPIISCTLALLLIISVIVNNLVKAPIAMYVVVLNNDASIVEVDDQVFINTLNAAGLDTKGKVVDITDYLTLGMGDEADDADTLLVLNALFSLTDLDLYVAPKEYFDMFAENDGFADLNTLIDKKLLEKHSEDLYKYENSEGQEIVGGIILHDNSLLHQAGYYHNDVIIGVVSNGVYQENATAFIKQLLND